MINKSLVIFLCILCVNSKSGMDDGVNKEIYDKCVNNTIDDKVNENVGDIVIDDKGNGNDDNLIIPIMFDDKFANNANNVTIRNCTNTVITITNSGIKTRDSMMMMLCLFTLFL